VRGCSIRCFTAQGGRQTDLNVDPRYPFELQSRFLSDIPAVRRAAWCGPLHGPHGFGARVYGLLLSVSAGAGLAMAGRQLWLQSLPADQVPACGPSVDYMLDVLPWMEVLTTALKGTGDCAEVTWRFLGLSIPGWTAIFFSLLVIVGLVMLFRPPTKPEWIQG